MGPRASRPISLTLFFPRFSLGAALSWWPKPGSRVPGSEVTRCLPDRSQSLGDIRATLAAATQFKLTRGREPPGGRRAGFPAAPSPAQGRAAGARVPALTLGLRVAPRGQVGRHALRAAPPRSEGAGWPGRRLSGPSE